MPFPGSAYDVVAVAASAGGLHALQFLLAHLPANFPAAGVVLMHLDPRRRSLLPSILGHVSALPVRQVQDAAALEPGVILVAPPNRHTEITPGLRLHLADTALVRFVRPAADVLFESLAEQCGPRGLAVVLTGNGRDGADGVAAVKRQGGAVIVQDPVEAEYPYMPEAAIKTGAVDMILPLKDIAPAIVRLVAPEPLNG